MPFSRGSSNKDQTVAAATGRRDRDSAEAGATTDQGRQEMVSQHVHEKAGEEGRWPGEGSESA